MTETSRPWQSTTPGDAGPYAASDWQQVWANIIGWGGKRSNVGVFLGTGTAPNEGLRTQAQGGNANIDVLTGAALVQGIAYLNTSTVSFTIAANSSGNPRIDTVVVQADYTAQTARLVLKQGTPAATPSPPTLTQSANVLWEIPVADIAVANGFVTIAQSNITSRREWINAPPGVYLDNVLNNSGVTLQDGDVVVWDSTADRAITTTTTSENQNVAGVWRGRTDTANYGRVQIAGIGYINANAAVTRGNLLATSTTAKQAGVVTDSGALLARALETTSGSGFVLCQINILVRGNTRLRLFAQTADKTIASSGATTTMFGTGVGSLTIPANLLTVGKSILVTLRGYLSSAVSAGTGAIAVTLGGVSICASATFTVTNSIANREWEIQILITCRSTGVSGTVVGQGGSIITNAASASIQVGIVATATATVDTTINETLDVTWTWGTPSSSNTITTTNAEVEIAA